MKKIISFICMAAALVAFASCRQTPTIEWSLTAAAEGDGLVTVSYPTGAFTADGKARVEATTAHIDTTVANGALTLTNGLASDDKEVVEAATAVSEQLGLTSVDVLKGEWRVDVTGFAKYGQIIFAIDEHWPKPDTTQVAE